MEDQKLIFNDTEYKIEDLTDKAKYCVSQIENIEQKIKQLNFELDQLTASKTQFISALSSELEESK